MVSHKHNTGAGSKSGPCDQRCVDVIVAAWNCENTIGRAVASALAQIEVRMVIVVDDASADKTADRAYAAATAVRASPFCDLPQTWGLRRRAVKPELS
jgi:Glycosyl transferase family 2